MHPPMSPLLIPMAGIGLAMIIVPLAIVTKYIGQQRQYRHLERMQALKSGVTPAAASPLPGPGAVVAIGAGVPAACMMAAFFSTLSVGHSTPDIVPVLGIIWSMSAGLGLCGLAGGLILGGLLHRANARAAETRDVSPKPAYDPDMFDAAHRGY